jgi:hypothetical protein
VAGLAVDFFGDFAWALAHAGVGADTDRIGGRGGWASMADDAGSTREEG